MDSKNKEFIQAAGRILIVSGTEGLTFKSLSKESGIEENDLIENFKNEGELMEVLLLGFEIELKKMLTDISLQHLSPEEEVEVMFKRLYSLFRQKPWNLTLIFNNSLQQRYKSFDKAIFRIQSMAKRYLTSLIERGKKQHVFETTESTRVLVADILGSFQSLMNDYQLGKEMIRGLKKLQSDKD